MPPRPRSPHGGDEDPPNDGGSPPRSHAAGGPRSVAHAEDTIADVALHGRARADGGAGPYPAATPASAADPVHSADDIQLSRWLDDYDKLGDEPPKINVAANDAAHQAEDAHTIYRHGPDIPLRRDTGTKTIEGRIYGDSGWDHPANASFKWTDPSSMNRTINDYVRQNWEEIRNNLASGGTHRAVFDAGHRIGEGFVNRGMFGAGPRHAQYATTSVVRITIDVVPGSDPPQPFIVTAFPAGLG